MDANSAGYPIEQHAVQKAAAAATRAKTITFEKAAENSIAAQEVAWPNGTHRQPWISTIECP
jgi:hypothetical protein